MKKAILLLCALLLTCAAFTACGETDEKSSGQSSSAAAPPKKASVMTKEIDEAVKNNPDIKPGAEVSGFIDEEGNQRFSYTNPDGGGGGGAVLN